MTATTIRRCLALACVSLLAVFAVATPTFAASWKHQELSEIPNIYNSKETRLRGISCLSSTSCLAVGEYALTLKGAGRPVSVVLNEKKWQANYPTSLEIASLNGISCVSATNCVAVGTSESGEPTPIAENWDGFSWTTSGTMRTVSGTGKATVLGVSCVASPRQCVAAGTGKRPGEGLAEAWITEGETLKTWDKLEAPSPKGATIAQENGVSCATSTSCVAVGNWRTAAGGETKPLVERWTSGKGTTAETPPVPRYAGLLEGKNASLNGVTCTGENCIAVGTYEMPEVPELAGKKLVFADSWNGKEWTAKELPDPSPKEVTGTELAGIACMSSTSCMAVGHFETKTHINKPLAELWNGTTWTLQEPPVPGGTTQSQLQGISCSASICYAVGYFAIAGEGGESERPLIDRYE
jgi:hypothetical protein